MAGLEQTKEPKLGHVVDVSQHRVQVSGCHLRRPGKLSFQELEFVSSRGSYASV